MRFFGRRGKRDPDQRLLAEARSGRAGAFEELRARHEEALTTFCANMLEHRHDEATGVVEETFAVARRELASTDGRAQVRPWLYAIGFERCIARLDELRSGSAAATGQGDEADQKRGALLMTGALPDSELVGLMSLADSRPSLFGLVGELTRTAPGAVAEFAVEEAATEAVAALGQWPGSGDAAESADDMAQRAARAHGFSAGGEAVARNADRVRRAATIAAATGSAAVVAGAGAFAIADPTGGGDGSRDRIVAPGPGVAAPAASRLPGGSGSAGAGSAGARLPGGDSAGGDRGRAGGASSGRPQSAGSRNGRDGRDGRDSSSGGGASGGDVVTDPGRFLPGAGSGGGPGGGSGGTGGGAGGNPGGGTGGGGGPGGGERPGGGDQPRSRSLLRVDAQVGPLDAHVEIP